MISNVSEIRGVDEGMLIAFFVADAESSGKISGERNVPQSATHRGVGGKVDVGVDTGERIADKRMARKTKMDKPPTGTPATEKTMVLKEAKQSATVVARSAT